MRGFILRLSPCIYREREREKRAASSNKSNATTSNGCQQRQQKFWLTLKCNRNFRRSSSWGAVQSGGGSTDVKRATAKMNMEAAAEQEHKNAFWPASV